MSANNELYAQVILDHNKNPRNFHTLEDCTHSAPGHNPLCGDKLDVYLIVKDDLVADISFKGSGCAISKASASMMTQMLKGKKTSEAKEIFSQFQSLVKGDLKPEEHEHILGKLKIFSGIWEFPARVKCAILSWHTMNSALDNGKKVSTE